MGAHPHVTRSDLAQQRVKVGAIPLLVNGVDPDEHAIKRG